MNHTIRSLAAALALTLLSGGLLLAQEDTDPIPAEAESDAPVPAAGTVEDTTSPDEAGWEEEDYGTRDRFTQVLLDHPRELATILALDPGLVANDEFLADYPAVARFVAAHPEVRRNPHFYLSQFSGRTDPRGVVGDIVELVAIFGTILLIALSLGWFIRTMIEQKRWNRLSQTQSEVHNKILERFETNEELLAYVRTPAGSRFLESAPIPLHAERAPRNPSISRVLWSIQIGVIVAAGAIGLLLVSGRFEPESAEGLSALGVIGICVGLGFVGSAAVSILLSRRLGLWEEPPTREMIEER